jgi:hypothetical protein
MLLVEVHRILTSKRNFMFSFMENYVCHKGNVDRDSILNTKKNFISIIRFCINTRQRQVTTQNENAISYFGFHYKAIRNAINDSDWDLLKGLIYLKHKDKEYMDENGLSYPIGVSQKIGSLILEVLIHYGETNPNLESKLLVPIDTHVHHIFSECLGIESVPGIGANITSQDFIDFQEYLCANTYRNNPRIYFDYLWFVGKVFCTQREKGNGFRLCNICWINRQCIYANKWF